MPFAKRLSTVALCVLFLSIGYTPYLLTSYFGLLNVTSGLSSLAGIWDNELYAWGLIFVVFQVAAIIIAKCVLPARRRTAIALMIIGALGVLMYIFSDWAVNLKPQSKADDESLHLLRFWVDGGGWLGVYIVTPPLIWYMYLLFRENFGATRPEQ